MFRHSFYKHINRSLFSKFKLINDRSHYEGHSHLPNEDGVKISFYSKVQVSKDGYVLRFLLPNSEHITGFKTCQYIKLESALRDSHEILSRPYHPISLDTDKGFIDILIKECGINAKFSHYLLNLQEGETIKMSGPFGRIIYNSHGKFTITRDDSHVLSKKVTKIGMIAGGTGISPMFQLIQKILSVKSDSTAMSLIYCTKLIEEMSFSEDLIKFDKTGNLSYFPVVEMPETNKWLYGKGFVTEHIIENFMPSPYDKNSLIFLCGPKVFVNDHLIPILKSMSYTDENILYY